MAALSRNRDRDLRRGSLPVRKQLPGRRGGLQLCGAVARVEACRERMHAAGQAPAVPRQCREVLQAIASRIGEERRKILCVFFPCSATVAGNKLIGTRTYPGIVGTI